MAIDIKTLTRSEIRYAIFRCRSGNPEKSHGEIYAYYDEKLKPHGLDFTSFTQTWDVAHDDPVRIVSGLDLTEVKDAVEGSLFDAEGNLKEPIPTTKVV